VVFFFFSLSFEFQTRWGGQGNETRWEWKFFSPPQRVLLFDLKVMFTFIKEK
jgi:hypothetical protein